MAYITPADRVRETSSTTGTGTLTLTGAAQACQTFLAGVGSGGVCFYTIAHATLNEWEVGIGTVSGSTLTRDTVIASSNSNALVSLSAGVKDVFFGMPASRALQDRPPSFRNKLRNPKGLIAQRGTSIAGPANGAYTLDGWMWGNTSAGVVTVSQQADAPSGAEYDTSIRVTVTTADASVAAGDTAQLYQPAEGYLVRDLQGNPVALQFDVRSAKTGTHCVSLRNSGLDRSYVFTYTVNAANTWEKKYLMLPTGLITAGTWNWTTGTGLYVGWTLMCGSTFQTAAGAWQTGNFLGTSAQANVLDTNGNIFAIGCPQLERGYEPGSLEHRDPGHELAYCQRFLAPVGAGIDIEFNGLTSMSNIMPLKLPVTMRATPTMTNASYSLQTNCSGTTLSALSADYARLTTTITSNGYTRIIVSAAGLASAELT